MKKEDSVEERHLEWSKKQAFILTGGGKAESLYTSKRGYPFLETELPHHHLLKGDTYSALKPDVTDSNLIISGAWNRSLFCGGLESSSDMDEHVYNVQTNNLFIDFRVPKSRKQVLQYSKVSSLEELSSRQLRLYARQHIFAGFTVLHYEKERPVATRHHLIDWNFVGVPRSRPNKWWIELNDDNSSWKECSYARDDNGQHYYFEQWDRLSGGISEPRLALRVSPSGKSPGNSEGSSRRDMNCQYDGVFVLTGDHFNYVMSRNLSSNECSYNDAASLVDLVDVAVNNGDLEMARSYLSIEGGHGLVSNGWKLDCSIPHWNEGKDIVTIGGSHMKVVGDNLLSCRIVWKGHNWDLYDCSFENVDDLKQFLVGSKISI
mmetsp:Transcript_12878/g.30406  ORF Transcript_12878/g.30406 Transcript_12878/m.30406 type:complete len:376 (+) Transcript_12878:86-1213(+)